LNLNALKKHIFFEFLNLAGRAYLLVRHSENVVLGNRGFAPDEKENGIILVFNPKMNFLWDEYGITATLVFGASPQKCFVPLDDITAIYSPELNAQFVLSPKAGEGSGGLETPAGKGPSPGKPEERKALKNVVKVDFAGKKRLNK